MPHYAVKRGHKVGIFDTWAECLENTKKFKKAIYRKFDTIEEAQEFMDAPIDEPVEMTSDEINVLVANPEFVHSFVDGSCDSEKSIYGYGGYLRANGAKHVLVGRGDNKEMAISLNVSGELLGAVKVTEKAIELGLKEFTMFYDYAGIEGWATGRYKLRIPVSIAYNEVMTRLMKQVDVKFVKVKAHTNIAGNEEVDQLAKMAVGLREMNLDIGKIKA